MSASWKLCSVFFSVPRVRFLHSVYSRLLWRLINPARAFRFPARTCRNKSTESNSVPSAVLLHHHYYSIVAASSRFVKNVVKSGEKKIVWFILSLDFYFEATVRLTVQLWRGALQKRNLPARREAADASVWVRGNSACLPFRNVGGLCCCSVKSYSLLVPH